MLMMMLMMMMACSTWISKRCTIYEGSVQLHAPSPPPAFSCLQRTQMQACSDTPDRDTRTKPFLCMRTNGHTTAHHHHHHHLGVQEHVAEVAGVHLARGELVLDIAERVSIVLSRALSCSLVLSRALSCSLVLCCMHSTASSRRSPLLEAAAATPAPPAQSCSPATRTWS